jgi:hypothetical protein
LSDSEKYSNQNQTWCCFDLLWTKRPAVRHKSLHSKSFYLQPKMTKSFSAITTRASNTSGFCFLRNRPYQIDSVNMRLSNLASRSIPMTKIKAILNCMENHTTHIHLITQNAFAFGVTLVHENCQISRTSLSSWLGQNSQIRRRHCIQSENKVKRPLLSK